MSTTPAIPSARGRHAPPLEGPLPMQRQRLLRAAAEEFARVGYAGASSETISRQAGLSKAAFYEPFSHKGECSLAPFATAAMEIVQAMGEAARGAGPDARLR